MAELPIDVRCALTIIERNSRGLWEHPKGSIYQHVLIANRDSMDQERFPTTVIYQDIITLQWWSRPVVEFAYKVTPWNSRNPDQAQTLFELRQAEGNTP